MRIDALGGELDAPLFREAVVELELAAACPRRTPFGVQGEAIGDVASETALGVQLGPVAPPSRLRLRGVHDTAVSAISDDGGDGSSKGWRIS